jgi:hypothetical protein
MFLHRDAGHQEYGLQSNKKLSLQEIEKQKK